MLLKHQLKCNIRRKKNKAILFHRRVLLNHDDELSVFFPSEETLNPVSNTSPDTSLSQCVDHNLSLEKFIASEHLNFAAGFLTNSHRL